jgi:hypothetical protein
MDDETTPAAPPSRRGFLIGGGVVVAVAAGGGVAVGLATGPDEPKALDTIVANLSVELTAAAKAERALIATVQAALTTAHGPNKRILRAILDDHTAHLSAIEATVTDDAYPATPPSSAAPSGATASPAPPTRARRADVLAAEGRASRAAAARALRLSGRDAVLFASIAASEATHAAVLA